MDVRASEIAAVEHNLRILVRERFEVQRKLNNARIADDDTAAELLEKELLGLAADHASEEKYLHELVSAPNGTAPRVLDLKAWRVDDMLPALKSVVDQKMFTLRAHGDVCDDCLADKHRGLCSEHYATVHVATLVLEHVSTLSADEVVELARDLAADDGFEHDITERELREARLRVDDIADGAPKKCAFCLDPAAAHKDCALRMLARWIVRCASGVVVPPFGDDDGAWRAKLARRKPRAPAASPEPSPKRRRLRSEPRDERLTALLERATAALAESSGAVTVEFLGCTASLQSNLDVLDAASMRYTLEAFVTKTLAAVGAANEHAYDQVQFLVAQPPADDFPAEIIASPAVVDFEQPQSLNFSLNDVRHSYSLEDMLADDAFSRAPSASDVDGIRDSIERRFAEMRTRFDAIEAQQAEILSLLRAKPVLTSPRYAEPDFDQDFIGPADRMAFNMAGFSPRRINTN